MIYEINPLDWQLLCMFWLFFFYDVYNFFQGISIVHSLIGLFLNAFSCVKKKQIKELFLLIWTNGSKIAQSEARCEGSNLWPSYLFSDSSFAHINSFLIRVVFDGDTPVKQCTFQYVTFDILCTYDILTKNGPFIQWQTHRQAMEFLGQRPQCKVRGVLTGGFSLHMPYIAHTWYRGLQWCGAQTLVSRDKYLLTERGLVVLWSTNTW